MSGSVIKIDFFIAPSACLLDSLSSQLVKVCAKIPADQDVCMKGEKLKSQGNVCVYVPWYFRRLIVCLGVKTALPRRAACDTRRSQMGG